MQIAVPMSLQATGVYTPDPARTEGFDIGQFFQAPLAHGQAYTTTFAFVVINGPIGGFRETISPMIYNYQNVTCWCGPTFKAAKPYIQQAQVAAAKGPFEYQGGTKQLEEVTGRVLPGVADAPRPNSAPGGNLRDAAPGQNASSKSSGGGSIAPWVIVIVLVFGASLHPPPTPELLGPANAPMWQIALHRVCLLVA